MSIWNYLKNRNYAIYSGEPSACLLKSKEGSWFPGVRVENISFPLTISPVQAALVSCLSEGHSPKTVYFENENDIEAYWDHQLDLEWVVETPKGLEISNLYNPVRKMDSPLRIEEQLKKLKGRARVAESNYPVMAILKVPSGYITGVNIEFSDWHLGLCAERTAIVKSFSAGISKFEHLYIHAPKGEFISPCGACRQVLVEHMADERLSLFHADGTRSSHFIKHLLPYNFQSKSLANK